MNECVRLSLLMQTPKQRWKASKTTCRSSIYQRPMPCLCEATRQRQSSHASFPSTPTIPPSNPTHTLTSLLPLPPPRRLIFLLRRKPRSTNPILPPQLNTQNLLQLRQSLPIRRRRAIRLLITNNHIQRDIRLGSQILLRELRLHFLSSTRHRFAHFGIDHVGLDDVVGSVDFR